MFFTKGIILVILSQDSLLTPGHLIMKKLLLATLLAPLALGAQNEFYNAGADIYIQKGALIHVQGSFIDENGSVDGIVKNDGIIEVKGDFRVAKNATFQVFNDNTSKDRVVKFVGTGQQNILGDLSGAGTNSFYNIVIDKGAATDQVEVQTDVVVEGSLVFNNNTTTTTYTPSALWTTNNNGGLLKSYTTSQEFLIDVQNGNTDAIGGYATPAINNAAVSNFVLTKGNRASSAGGLQRRVTGTLGYLYPIGTLTNGYNPVRLNFTSVPASGSVKGKFCDGSSNPAGFIGYIQKTCPNCPVQPWGVQMPDNNGYNRYFSSDPCNGGQPQWIILEDAVKDHGYWSYSGPANYQYYIESYPTSYTGLGNAADNWRMIKFPTPYGDDPSESGDDWSQYIESSVSSLNDLITYTKLTGSTAPCYAGDAIPGGIYTGFSHFAAKSSMSNSALPVELIFLKAEPVNNQFIQVSWATAVEINNAGFHVERSTDGINFQDIGWVDGHNNSTQTLAYAFDDHNVASDVVYYYKLRQQDNDGQTEETYVVSAMITDGTSFAISDFIPNPSNNQTKLVITTSVSMDVDVKLYDMLGRELSVAKYGLSAGQNNIDFNTQMLADATYTAVISTGNKVYSKKLVVSKN